MEGLTVRAERSADHGRIGEVTTAAFGKEREARMVEEIRDSEGFVPELSLVAEVADEIVAHVLLSYVELQGETETWRVLELGPMSVVPERQNSGVGTALITEALYRAEARGDPLVLVLGHASYYPRFGFSPASQLGITPPDPNLPDEVFMALPLRAYDAAMRGRVAWPPAFTG